MMTILAYDSTFEGFLTCVFEVYEQKLTNIRIVPMTTATATFFDQNVSVTTIPTKAKRVWDGLQKKSGSRACSMVYKAFLSELDGIEDTLLCFIQKCLQSAVDLTKNYTDPDVLRIAKVVKMIGREKHRMDAFVRFRETKEGLYFATIAPDFNVLPLNAKHFKNRYADQKWLIYDTKRGYGIYYDLNTLDTVALALEASIDAPSKATLYFSETELQFQELWQNYFKSTNIESRKNMRLHIRHVPKRYWKYLSEKQE